MSFSVDVNVLLYASDSSSPIHDRAQAFLKECAEGPEVFCLAWQTLMGYLRMSTHSTIFSRPLTPKVAASNVESLIALPHVRVVAEEDGFWQLYRETTASQTVRGNLVPDAHLVALLRLHGVARLYTRDRDFRRFSGIRVVDPFA